MSWPRFIILLYVATVLQTTVVPVLLPVAAGPHLLLVLAGYCALMWPSDRALVAGALAGLAADLTSLSPLGTQTLGIGLFVLWVRRLRPIIFTEFPFAHAVFAFGGYLTLVLVYTVLSRLPTGAPRLPLGVLDVFLRSLSTAATAAAVCMAAERWRQRGRSRPAPFGG